MICAIVYVCYILKSINGQLGRFEDVWASDGYDAYDKQTQEMLAEGWEFVQYLHNNWERKGILQSARKLGARLQEPATIQSIQLTNE